MYKILILCFIVLVLGGCVRKMNIEQGNVIEPSMPHQLHVGMTAQEVKNIMGNPVLINTFNDSRLDYVYTYKPGGGVMTEKYMTLIFDHGHLKEVKSNLYAQYMR